MKREVSAEKSAGQSNPFFTASNLLSIFRGILSIPFAVVMLSKSDHSTVWGSVIILVAAITDKFDGLIARKNNEVTEWGKILDPLADKIGIGVVAIVLVLLGFIPLWFVLVLLARDVLILAGGLFLKKTRSTILQSNQLGKWTIGVLAITMACAMLGWALGTQVFVWLSTAMLLVSFMMYLYRFVQIVRTGQAK